MSSALSLRRLLPGEKVDFECIDADLTEFFREDCLNYLSERLAVTYVLEFQGEAIAMFSLSNDRLDIHDFEDNHKLLKKAAGAIPHAKRGLRSFPAVKIGRLAVKKGLERGGHRIGSSVVVFIQAFLMLKNKTGCRFLTVDSYPGAVEFYRKAGFKKVEKATGQEIQTCPHCKEALPLDSKAPPLDDNVLMFLDLVLMTDSKIIDEFSPIVDSLLQMNVAEFPEPPESAFREKSAFPA
jgi:hypothetical protein